MHTFWNTLADLWRVSLAALLFGAGLPMVFAIGIRVRAHADDGVTGPDRAIVLALSVLCFAVVTTAVVAGVLFIAREFLATRLGIHLFGT